MKRKLLLTVTTVLAVPILGLVTMFLLLRPVGVLVTQNRVDRIQPGMTLGEVESIFGGAEGNYLHDGYEAFAMTIVLAADNRDARFWLTESGGAAVFFDEHDRVRDASPTFYSRQQQPWHVRLREWLGL